MSESIFIRNTELVFSKEPVENAALLIIEKETSIQEICSYFWNKESQVLERRWIQADSPEEARVRWQKGLEFRRAAGGFVRNEQHEALLINRFGHWDLPKGHLKKKESPEAGAVREVEEECSITRPEVVVHLPKSYHVYAQKKHFVLKETTWFLMDYEGTETPKPQLEEHISDARWVPAHAIEDLMGETYASLVPVLTAGLAYL